MTEQINKFPKSSGVYRITSPTGKNYIGEATNLNVRCRYYLTPSRVKNQVAIYNSLIKYGVESHTIEIIEECAIENLLERERFWQEQYDSVNNGLNCYLTKTSNKPKSWSIETKLKMSNSAKGTKNGFYGKKHTNESLKKISLASKGKNNPNFDSKFHNESYIQKQINSNSKRPVKVINTLTGETFVFKNSKDAAKFCNATSTKIRYYKNKNWKVNRIYLVIDAT